LSQPINPYAVSAPAEDTFHPIHFGGTSTRDDLMMSLLDSPPRKGWARLRGPTTSLLIAAGVLLIVSEFDGEDEPLPSILWILCGFLASPAWLKLARVLTPGRRKQIERINRMADKQKPTWGWFEEEIVVLRDQNSTLKARWNFFVGPMIFPEHFMLPMTSDATRRIILPWRFFASPDDANTLIQLAAENHHAVAQDRPNLELLVDLISQGDGFVQSDIDEAKLWDKDHWPFTADADGQFDCEIDTAAVMGTRWFAMYSAFAIVLVIVWYFLPIWVAAAGWLLYEYMFFGNWQFIFDRPFSSLLVIGPTIAILIFFLYFVLKSLLSSRQIQKQPLGIRLRKAGVYLSHESFESWFRWPMIEHVIIKPDRAGWLVEETGDQAEFPQVCFENEETFEQFKTVLQAVGPSAQVEQTSTT
jgi:hypothetical protein